MASADLAWNTDNRSIMSALSVPVPFCRRRAVHRHELGCAAMDSKGIINKALRNPTNLIPNAGQFNSILNVSVVSFGYILINKVI